MSDLFDRLDAPTAAAEGGYVNNPDDAGGETMRGITVRTARENGYSGPMAAMTADQAKAIRRSRYFIRSGVYLLAAASERVASEVYDAGVLSGPGAAAIWLQRALNVLNRGAKDYADIPVDGGVGPTTAQALAAYLKRNGPPAELRLCKVLNCLQGAFLVEIGEHRGANESFENGWFDNRISL